MTDNTVCEVGLGEVRQGNKRLRKEKGGERTGIDGASKKSFSSTHTQKKNIIRTGMDTKINGRTGVWRKQRLKMLKKRATERAKGLGVKLLNYDLISSETG